MLTLLSQLPLIAQQIVVLLGALSAICFALQALPGTLGHFFAVATIDVRKLADLIRGMFPGSGGGGNRTTAVPPYRGPRLPVMMLAFTFALALPSCAWFTPKRVQSAADIALCVLAHDTEPVTQIAADCAIQTIKDIEDILASARRVGAKHCAAAASASVAPSASASVKP